MSEPTNETTPTGAEAPQEVMPIVFTEGRDRVERVAPHIFRIDLPMPKILGTTSSYLITGGKHNLLIDAGCNLKQTEEALDLALSRLNVSWNTVDVFLTHSHFDHCAGLTRIGRQGMLVYSGMEDYRDREMPIMGNETLYRMSEECCRNHDVPYKMNRDWWAPMADRGSDDIRVTTMEDGDIIKVGDYRFECLSTPGHDPSHLCLYEPTAKILFTGDQVTSAGYPSLTLATEMDSYALFQESLARLRELPCDLALPGHGDSFSNLAERCDKISGHFSRQLEGVREIVAQGVTDPVEITYLSTHLPRRGTWESRSPFGMNTLMEQTMGYLQHLVYTGEYPHPELLWHQEPRTGKMTPERA